MKHKQQEVATVVVTVLSLPARCDCGYRWTFCYSNDPGQCDGNLMCPACGAGLEVRAYGPLAQEEADGG